MKQNLITAVIVFIAVLAALEVQDRFIDKVK